MTIQARSIHTIAPLREQRIGERLMTRDAQTGLIGADLDPFIMVSFYAMRGPTFPPHPHAGFMVATYILPESRIGFINQDSLGTRNRIAPGALHVTVAGRGVLHEEQPEQEGDLAEGFQIWIDLPEAERESAPHSLHLPADDVPRLSQSGLDLRVVAGEQAGARSPLRLPTAISLLDVTLAPDAEEWIALPHGERPFAFMLGGSLRAGQQEVGAGRLVCWDEDGDGIALKAGMSGARFTLFSGGPLRQRRAMRGPFVASNEAQLARFGSDFAAGRFGTLRPLSAG
ncbi:MAG: pirin-like C-terminal cupin domain-containing protein [Burkholderiales bacterium]|nr:pirin-like C-terminal cupin domain-containing protein [Burkholderiales bacterium]